MPERPELDDVILVGLVLLQHRADYGGDSDYHQYRDRQIHGAEKLEPQGRQFTLFCFTHHYRHELHDIYGTTPQAGL